MRGQRVVRLGLGGDSYGRKWALPLSLLRPKEAVVHSQELKLIWEGSQIRVDIGLEEIGVGGDDIRRGVK